MGRDAVPGGVDTPREDDSERSSPYNRRKTHLLRCCNEEHRPPIKVEMHPVREARIKNLGNETGKGTRLLEGAFAEQPKTSSQAFGSWPPVRAHDLNSEIQTKVVIHQAGFTMSWSPY